MQRRSLSLFADYFQFYLWDAGMNAQAPVEYTRVDLERRIKTGPNVVVIVTARNMTVPVTIEIVDAEPSLDISECDHVAEASLHLPTGRLQVHECTGGEVADFEIAPDWYRVRSCHTGLDSIDSTGLEGNDRYHIALWPAPDAEVRVIKQAKQVGAAG
jgi:hypothetical protein